MNYHGSLTPHGPGPVGIKPNDPIRANNLFSRFRLVTKESGALPAPRSIDILVLIRRTGCDRPSHRQLPSGH